ncbi:hypothetical protein BB560_006236, partial [Smittium megazygosporum]
MNSGKDPNSLKNPASEEKADNTEKINLKSEDDKSAELLKLLNSIMEAEEIQSFENETPSVESRAEGTSNKGAFTLNSNSNPTGVIDLDFLNSLSIPIDQPFPMDGSNQQPIQID